MTAAAFCMRRILLRRIPTPRLWHSPVEQTLGGVAFWLRGAPNITSALAPASCVRCAYCVGMVGVCDDIYLCNTTRRRPDILFARVARSIFARRGPALLSSKRSEATSFCA